MAELNSPPHSFFGKEHINFDYSQPESYIILDLIDVFGSIYYKDITVEKDKSLSVPRNIELHIPVTNKKLWEKTVSTLQEIVKFVSKDNLKIEFYEEEKEYLPEGFRFPYEGYKVVTLLSGGLDSFSGAYMNIHSNLNSIYSGYVNSNQEQKPQKTISDFVRKQDRTSSICLFPKLDVEKREPTQSTRSLLFLTLACSIACTNQIKTVYIYENGVLSLNPTLNGRFTTRTTHPKTLFLYNQILKMLNLDLKIENPFVFETKGEIINRLSDEFKQQIRYTHTCSTSRQNQYVGKHQCGWCVPCLLRKISICAYDLEHYDTEYHVPYGAKLKDIKEEYRQNEFKSSVEYFREVKALIDSGEIFLHIDGFEKEYYECTDYQEKTYDMLKRFSLEFERFWNKNEIY